jgi:hypothetical protein
VQQQPDLAKIVPLVQRHDVDAVLGDADRALLPCTINDTRVGIYAAAIRHEGARKANWLYGVPALNTTALIISNSEVLICLIRRLSKDANSRITDK